MTDISYNNFAELIDVCGLPDYPCGWTFGGENFKRGKADLLRTLSQLHDGLCALDLANRQLFIRGGGLNAINSVFHEEFRAYEGEHETLRNVICNFLRAEMGLPESRAETLQYPLLMYCLWVRALLRKETGCSYREFFGSGAKGLFLHYAQIERELDDCEWVDE